MSYNVKGEFGNQYEFVFSENQEWQDAIYSIFIENHEYIESAVITNGKIDFPYMYSTGTLPYTIKAHGYEDVVITVEIPFGNPEMLTI